jgi:hypothetical protein
MEAQAINELTVESEGLRVAVRAERGDVWLAARAALDAAAAALGHRNDYSHHPPIESGASSHGTASEQIRAIAAEMLADGRSRERRVLAKAVRDAGVKSEGLDAALSRDPRFERDHNVAGRPIWRDISVPRPAAPAPVPDSEKPEWMRTPIAANGAMP